MYMQLVTSLPYTKPPRRQLYTQNGPAVMLKFCGYACSQCLVQCFGVAQDHHEATRTANVDGDDEYHVYVTIATTSARTTKRSDHDSAGTRAA